MKYSVIEELNNPDFNPDDYAPRDEGPKNLKNNRAPELKTKTVAYVAVTVILTVILAIFGTIFAFNSSDEAAKAAMVLSYFDNSEKCEFYKTAEDREVYVVYYGDCITGYGVYLTEKGFSGPVDILVCINGSGEVENVSIISEKEIQGLGSRIRNTPFLDGFKGLKSGDNMKKVLVSGATTSCDAVKNAVKDVLNWDIINLDSISRDTGKKVLTPSELDKKINEGKDKDKDKKDEETTDDDSSRPSGYHFETNDNTDTNRINGNDGAQNTNNGDGDVNADGNDVTTEYDTESDTTDETTAEDTTAADTTAGPVETTAAPVVETTAAPVVETTAAPEPETTEAPSEPETTEAPEDSDEGGNG